MKKLLVPLLFAICGSPIAFATVATVNYTDLWWNPAESGWGVTIAQQHTTLFLTFYLYGADGTPTWAVAQLERTGTGPGGQPVFSGGVSTTTGAWFGGPHAPAVVHAAGTATFAPADATSGRLDYSIDGVTVSKTIRRQTLTHDNLSGTYVVFADAAVTCPGVGSFSDYLMTRATITQSGVQFLYRESSPTEPTEFCNWTGTWGQDGQLGHASGTVTCSDSSTGSFAFTDVSSNPLGFTARMTLQAKVQGVSCTLTAPIAGMKQ